jgi:hypothetical protein
MAAVEGSLRPHRTETEPGLFSLALSIVHTGR